MLSAIIPTLDRFESLGTTLKGLTSGDRVPDEILIIGVRRTPIPEKIGLNSPAKVLYAERASAAGQRNLGADHAKGDLLLFIDDDITPAKNCLRLLAEALYENPDLAGVAGHMEGSTHSNPGRLLRLYYRLQAGYTHPNYGAQIFGPAITTFPCYETAGRPLIEAEWLNSALVVYRKKVFDSFRFPDFSGYSPFEDAHLSASIAKNHRLAFHRDALYQHRGAPGTPHGFEAGKHFIENLRTTAAEALGTNQVELTIKLTLHKLFIITHLARCRPPGWISHATGVLVS